MGRSREQGCVGWGDKAARPGESTHTIRPDGSKIPRRFDLTPKNQRTFQPLGWDHPPTTNPRLPEAVRSMQDVPKLL